MTSTDRWSVCCQIVTWVSDDPEPGIVECRLVDAFGHSWTFVGKVAYFTGEMLSSESKYPQMGYIACEIVARQVGERELVEIDTYGEKMRGYRSEDGRFRFQVAVDQLVSEAISEEIVSITVVTATLK